MPTPENNESIPAIDDTLRRIQTRLREINTNLHDGLFGETPTDCEKEDAIAMPTPSLSSLARRCREVHGLLDACESHVTNIHPSNAVGNVTSPRVG